LDNRARILSVNTGLAGSGFLGLAKERQSKLHERLHPACRGKCRFKKLWKTAWRELTTNDSVEWEINDAVSGKFLRLNLTKPPSTRVVEHDRRQGHALLTITDITRHRREYETLVRRERTLIKLLQDQGLETSAVLNSNSDNVASTPPIGAEGAEQSVRVLSRQAILAQEDERRRIARELHDSIAQLAGVIKYNIEADYTPVYAEHGCRSGSARGRC
jgi:hypothetical protein